MVEERVQRRLAAILAADGVAWKIQEQAYGGPTRQDIDRFIIALAAQLERAPPKGREPSR